MFRIVNEYDELLINGADRKPFAFDSAEDAEDYLYDVFTEEEIEEQGLVVEQG